MQSNFKIHHNRNAGKQQSQIIIPKQVKTIQSHFDYSVVWSFLYNKGVELYGADFKVLQEDADIIIKLITWFIKDELTAIKLGIDLTKSILLLGLVGCGKTSLMNLCRYQVASEERHTMRSCREITFEFIKDGYASLL